MLRPWRPARESAIIAEANEGRIGDMTAMNDGMLHRLTAMPEREVFPGFLGRMVHTEATTLAYWTIAAGSVLPEHSHPHEQIVNMFSGELELTVDGAHHVLGPGDVLVIPGGAVHSGQARSEVRVLDVFTPVREDYRALDGGD